MYDEKLMIMLKHQKMGQLSPTYNYNELEQIQSSYTFKNQSKSPRKFGNNIYSHNQEFVNYNHI